MIVRDVMCLRYSRYRPYIYAHIFYINLIFLKVFLSSRVAFSSGNSFVKLYIRLSLGTMDFDIEAGAIFINDIFIWAIEKKYNFLKNFIFIYRYVKMPSRFYLCILYLMYQFYISYSIIVQMELRWIISKCAKIILYGYMFAYGWEIISEVISLRIFLFLLYLFTTIIYTNLILLSFRVIFSISRKFLKKKCKNDA